MAWRRRGSGVRGARAGGGRAGRPPWVGVVSRLALAGPGSYGCAPAPAPCLIRPVRAAPWSTPLHTDYVTRAAQVMGLFDLSSSSAPSREAHERSTTGTSRVNERSAETGAVGHAGPRLAQLLS